MAQGDNKTTQKGTNAMFVMMHDKIAHAHAAQIFSLTATLSLIIVHKKNSHIESELLRGGICLLMNLVHLCAWQTWIQQNSIGTASSELPSQSTWP
jgi:hypothetical protein